MNPWHMAHRRPLAEYEHFISRGNKHLALDGLRRAARMLEGEIANDESEARERALGRARTITQLRSTASLSEDSPPAQYRAIGVR